MDGVLVDSEIHNASVVTEYLQDLNIEICTDEVIFKYTGLSSADMLHELRQTTDIRVPEEFLEELTNRVLQRFETELKPVKGVQLALTKISQRRCVASSSRTTRIRKCLHIAGVLDYFEPNLFSAEQVKHGKPAPDLFLYASKALGFLPRDCIVVEDSPRGIAAAKAANMPVIGFVGASHAEFPWYIENVVASQPDVICRSMDELPNIINEF